MVLEEYTVDQDMDVDGLQDAAAEYTTRKIVFTILGLVNTLESLTPSCSTPAEPAAGMHLIPVLTTHRKHRI